MTVRLAAGLLCLSGIAGAESLDFNFTASPIFTTGGTWTSTDIGVLYFNGSYNSSSAATGTEFIAVVDPPTGEQLDLINLTFFSGSNGDGVPGPETVSATVSILDDPNPTIPSSDVIEPDTGFDVTVPGLPPDLLLSGTDNSLSQTVPEPGTLALLGIGLAALTAVKRKSL